LYYKKSASIVFESKVYIQILIDFLIQIHPQIANKSSAGECKIEKQIALCQQLQPIT
jgi:hypothetical protein